MYTCAVTPRPSGSSVLSIASKGAGTISSSSKCSTTERGSSSDSIASASSTLVGARALSSGSPPAPANLACGIESTSAKGSSTARKSSAAGTSSASAPGMCAGVVELQPTSSKMPCKAVGAGGGSARSWRRVDVTVFVAQLHPWFGLLE